MENKQKSTPMLLEAVKTILLHGYPPPPPKLLKGFKLSES